MKLSEAFLCLFHAGGGFDDSEEATISLANIVLHIDMASHHSYLVLFSCDSNRLHLADEVSIQQLSPDGDNDTVDVDQCEEGQTNSYECVDYIPNMHHTLLWCRQAFLFSLSRGTTLFPPS